MGVKSTKQRPSLYILLYVWIQRFPFNFSTPRKHKIYEQFCIEDSNLNIRYNSVLRHSSDCHGERQVHHCRNVSRALVWIPNPRTLRVRATVSGACQLDNQLCRLDSRQQMFHLHILFLWYSCQKIHRKGRGSFLCWEVNIMICRS